MKRLLKASSLLLCLMLLCSGCAQIQNNNSPVSAHNAASKNAAIRFTDARGKEIVLQKPAERIISLYSAHTENLYALGAGDKLIGGSNSEVYPEEALLLPVYHYREDPEKVIAAMPDLVLVRPMIERVVPEYIEALERAGLTVASIYPDTAEEFDEYIHTLALITDTQLRAEELLAYRAAHMEFIAQRMKDIPPVKVFVETTADPLRTLTADALAAVNIRLAGGELIASDAAENPGSSMVEYPVEKLIEKADQIDVYVAQLGGMNKTVTIEDIHSRPGYLAIKAVQNGNVLIIDEKLIASPTFRQLDGIALLAEAFAAARENAK